MAIRQYIGARYVPRFIGTYDPTQIYEALDVVDNGSGTSYIARKNVPAGTPLTDTSYWFVYGASSGAIVQLQNDMIQAQGDIITLQGDMTTAQGNITSLQGAMSAAQGDIGNIKNKKVGNLLVFGNSYVGFGCIDALETHFEHSYRFTSSGIGFVAHTGHPNIFEDLLDNAIASSSFDNDTITDIIFVSAVGDARAITELNTGAYMTALRSSLASMFAKIQANFPNCKRRVVTLAESRAVPYFGDSSYRALFNAHRIFKLNCEAYGFSYIGFAGFNNLFIATLFESDNYHPNAAGAKEIAQWIESAYYGNVTYAPKTANADADFKYTAAGKIRVVALYDPDFCTLSMRRATQTYGDPVTINANDVLVDMSGVASPPPPPIQEIEFYGNWFNAATGADVNEFMRCKFSWDTHGIAAIVLQSAPNNSNCPAQYMQSYNSQTITYMPG